jgi:signal transduction histidine kinase
MNGNDEPPAPRRTAATRDATAVGEQQRQRQAVLDALPAQVALLDADGRITAVNAAWRRFADDNGGDSCLREGIGLDYLAVCRVVAGDNGEQARRIADGIESVIARRTQQFICEYPCHSPVRWRWMALSATPLDDDSRGAVVVHTDITERKQAERDARLARESMAKAARLNAVGILASSLIHELTQPLSAASFFSGTATSLLDRQDIDPERLRRVLAGVEAQILRASTTLQRLRHFLRSQEMRLRPVPIGRIIDQAIELVRWFAADRQVQLEFDNPLPGIRVMADPVQLEQVLLNLIFNSIQAIDDAGSRRRVVRIDLERIVLDAEGNPGPLAAASPQARDGSPLPAARAGEAMVRVSVQDSGPGLPASDTEQLFNIFTSTRDSGLGLGLAISRDIIESHGGRLWAEPAPREGACFRFSLPMADE